MARRLVPWRSTREAGTMDPGGCDSEVLARRAQTGDRDAFARLFHCTHRAVYGLLSRMTGSPEEAEDLSQDTYLEAWRGLRSLRDPGAFRTWLFRIAVNKARDHRKRRRLPTQSLSDLRSGDGQQVDLPDTGPPMSDSVLAEERDRRVRAAVAALSPEHQEVVTLYYVADLPVREIARALGVPKGTVLSRLARAREALRRDLAPYMEDGHGL